MMLSAAARADANEAMAIVERGAQTPVIQSGVTNPFDTPNSIQAVLDHFSKYSA